MKIVDGFVMKNIAGTHVVVPVGSNTVSFKAVITLNETGAFLWEQLVSETDENQLVDAMLKEYDIDRDTAVADVAEFVENLKKAELLK